MNWITIIINKNTPFILAWVLKTVVDFLNKTDSLFNMLVMVKCIQPTLIIIQIEILCDMDTARMHGL